MTSEIAFDRPAIRAATSAVAAVPRYQTCGRSATHSRASVVFPKPAGATSISARALALSSSRVSLGRLMM